MFLRNYANLSLIDLLALEDATQIEWILYVLCGPRWSRHKAQKCGCANEFRQCKWILRRYKCFRPSNLEDCLPLASKVVTT